MSIVFAGLTDEQGSPFLAVNERSAQEWSSFAAQVGSEASGRFNAWHFEAQITVSTHNIPWVIQGHKRQSTVGGSIPMNSLIHEETRFSGHLGTLRPVLFNVRRTGWLTWFVKLGGPIFPSGISKNFMVRTEDLADYQNAIVGHEQTLRDLHIDKLELTTSLKINARSTVLMTTREELRRALFMLTSMTRSR